MNNKEQHIWALPSKGLKAILDDKDRLEDILHDLEIIAKKRYINAADRRNLLVAQDLVVKVAGTLQLKISQSR